MCNCNNTQPCNSCQSGYQCNCPPNYYVAPASTGCLCCPPGYNTTTVGGVTMCQSIASPQSAPIPQVQCNPCPEIISSNCVQYVAAEGYPVNCFGIVNGDSLTTMINKMCLGLQNNIETILSAIGLNPTLESAFCQLVNGCSGTNNSGTPIIGVITVTFP